MGSSMIQSKKKKVVLNSRTVGGARWGEGSDFREGILECSLHSSDLHCARARARGNSEVLLRTGTTTALQHPRVGMELSQGRNGLLQSHVQAV